MSIGDLSIPDVSFGISIDFTTKSGDPSRVFRSMTSLIQAFQAVDLVFAGPISPSIRPILLLEDIQTGSLTTFLRVALESIDNDGLKGLEWKKLVGAYLVKGKGLIVNYLKDRETIQSPEELYDLQKVIAAAARETGVVTISTYAPPSPIAIAKSVRLISEATRPLDPSDRAIYLSPDGVSEINTGFEVSEERIEQLLTERTIVNSKDMLLKVKKPDFLGSSMWDFRFEGRPLPAKVLDVEWLKQFRNGHIGLRPGDALDVAAEEEVHYGFDGEVLATHHRVVVVRGVVSRPKD
jgi:hypothetical protein